MNSAAIRIIADQIYLNLGIVPLHRDPNTFRDVDVETALKKLPLKEQNKMKRKFRKIWRKIEKERIAARSKRKDRLWGFRRGEVGLMSRSPTKLIKKRRKDAVHLDVTDQAFKLYEQFEESLKKRQTK